MSPTTKKIKIDHVTEDTVAQPIVEEKEPDWYLLEDLEAEDIDDEFGDMIIEQRLLVNNEVCFSFFFFMYIFSNVKYRMHWNVLQKILNIQRTSLGSKQ